MSGAAENEDHKVKFFQAIHQLSRVKIAEEILEISKLCEEVSCSEEIEKFSVCVLFAIGSRAGAGNW